MDLSGTAQNFVARGVINGLFRELVRLCCFVIVVGGGDVLGWSLVVDLRSSGGHGGDGWRSVPV